MDLSMAGRPVTAGLDYFEHPDGILGIYDSQGFETGEAGDVVLARLDQIVRESRAKPIADVVPESARRGYDIHKGIDALVDEDSFFEPLQALDLINLGTF